MTTKKSGEKFDKKYGVETATIYKGDTDALQIPPPNHPLYDKTSPAKFDPTMVATIERDGKMTDPIEVWSDPDNGILWVLDGRSRTLAVREVNRIRKAEKRELVKPLIVPFHGNEDEAFLRVREKNYHRRIPTTSDKATDLKEMHRRGVPWAKCAFTMNQKTKDPEQWGRKLLPVAYCIPSVQTAIDDGLLPLSAATKFGGSAPDGSKAIGKGAQAELLAEMIAAKEKAAQAPSTSVGPKTRERALAVLSNGAAAKLKGEDREVAKVVAATLARIGGDTKALKEWPEVAEIVEEALKPLPKGPKIKKADKDAE